MPVTDVNAEQLAFVKIWIAALRSGEYRQCSGGLRRPIIGHDFYCCLGVACEIAPDITRFGDTIAYNFGRDVTASIIPDEDWKRLTGLPYHVREECVYLNDASQANFKVIADYLEKEAGIVPF